MAANRTKFILSEIQTVLGNEASFNVTAIHKPKFTSGINAYPYMVSQRATGDNLEDYSGDSIGQAEVGILFDAQAGGDPAGAGVSTDLYADIVDKCENVFADYEASIATSKPRDTHSSGNFRTVINGCKVTGWDGHYDNTTGRIMVGCRVIVDYYHIAI